jgi:hypothetical protein
MALYDTRFGLPQIMADYLNQALPEDMIKLWIYSTYQYVWSDGQRLIQ